MFQNMLTLFSPAKINLFLHITGRRHDGYHNLASLFQTIDLGDKIDFSIDTKDSLVCSDKRIPTDFSNLIFKAADLFRKKTGLSFGLKVFLEKKIPIEAGLGGGSSNAATTFWALNTLCNQPATLDELQQWSSEVGSDVPFFFTQGTAYCTGRGEECREVAIPKIDSFYVVKPREGLATPRVYQQLQGRFSDDPGKQLHEWVAGKAYYHNDLEKPAFELCPSLAELKQNLLLNGFHTVFMTGSGSAFICIGQGKILSSPDIFVSKAKFLRRQPNHWYLNPDCDR